MLTELYSETDTMNNDEECLVVGAWTVSDCGRETRSPKKKQINKLF